MKVVPVQGFNCATMAATTAPYGSAPSSPKTLVDGDPFDLDCHCTSALTSPTLAPSIHEHFCTVGYLPPPPATTGIPFNWEEKPGTPKSHLVDGDGSDKLRFAFDRCEEVDFASEEIVGEARRIMRPLKPPPRLQYPAMDDVVTVAPSPMSPRPRGLWSSAHQRKGGGREGDGGLDPFTIAMMKATKDKLSTSSSFVNSSERGHGGGSGASSKLRLWELLLFRRASRDFLGKCAVLCSSRSPSSSMKVDAFEAAAEEAEEMKEKSALRHRQGLLSSIRFGSSCHGSYSGQGH